MLSSGEFLAQASGFPAIAYYRKGSDEHPLIVALPGGGHLGRIFYGHPGGRREDFLDYWLERCGYGLLALSYPSDHPAFEQHHPWIGVSDWADVAAGITASVARQHQLSGDVLLTGWSMGGRVCNAFNVAAQRHGLKNLGFVALAATPPLPALADTPPQGQLLTPKGFWQTQDPKGGLLPRHVLYLDDLHWASGGRQRTIVSEQDYLRYYVVNTPVRLRGEPNQGQSVPRNLMSDTIEDLGTFNFADYPLTGIVAPTAPSDARHVLTDQATWTFLNSQKLYARLLETRDNHLLMADGPVWDKVRQIVSVLPERLYRVVEGGHFFFVGQSGAQRTASHIADLSETLRQIEGELQEFATSGADGTAALLSSLV